MIPYHVTFSMPPWIAEGIANGTMEAIGGVVRNIDTKQVVMWLRPGLEETAKAAAPLLGPLGGLTGTAALSLVGTAGLGVVAFAGFAVLKGQLAKVDSKLDDLKKGQGRLQDGMNELLEDAFAKALQETETAVETIAMEEERRAFDKLQAPIMMLREKGKFFAHKMEGVLKQETPLARATLFAELAKLFVLAAQAKGRALMRYDSLAAAQRELQSDQERYAKLRQRFLEPLAAPAQHLEHFARLTAEHDSDMRLTLPHLPRAEALNFVNLPGLPDNPEMLSQLLDLLIARPGEPVAGIVVASEAPAGWMPEPVMLEAAPQQAHR